MAPRVSILMPVRDAGPWIGSALRSIRRQTFPDWELVAVDDGTRDASRSLLEDAARRDGRIRILETEPAQRGLVAALQVGLAACRGDLVARCDADDAMTRRRLELQVRALDDDPSLTGISCRVRIVPRRGLRDGSRRYEAWLNGLQRPEDVARERFVESPLAHPSVTLRTEALRAVGGYRDRDWPEDYDLWLRLLARAGRFAKVDRVLQLWRDHPERATRRDPRYERGRFEACKAHHLLRGPLAGAEQWAVWGAGPTGKRLARLLEASGGRPAFFVDVGPRRIGGRARGAPVVSPGELPRVWPVRGTVLLVAVARWGARTLIRTELTKLGRREGVDYWCVA